MAFFSGQQLLPLQSVIAGCGWTVRTVTVPAARMKAMAVKRMSFLMVVPLPVSNFRCCSQPLPVADELVWPPVSSRCCRNQPLPAAAE